MVQRYLIYWLTDLLELKLQKRLLEISWLRVQVGSDSHMTMTIF